MLFQCFQSNECFSRSQLGGAQIAGNQDQSRVGRTREAEQARMFVHSKSTQLGSSKGRARGAHSCSALRVAHIVAACVDGRLQADGEQCRHASERERAREEGGYANLDEVSGAVQHDKGGRRQVEDEPARQRCYGGG